MIFFAKPQFLRRFKEPEIVEGYYNASYDDITLPANVQTLEDEIITASEGERSVRRLEMFSDERIMTDDPENRIKADMLWYQGKWYQCRSSVLCDTTILKHWDSVFVECLIQDAPPEAEGK